MHSLLRAGNVHSAAGRQELLLPEIGRPQKQGKQVVFRAGPGGHPAFAKPELYQAPEERGRPITLDITGVGTAFPGAPLVVTIRM